MSQSVPHSVVSLLLSSLDVSLSQLSDSVTIRSSCPHDSNSTTHPETRDGRSLWLWSLYVEENS